MAIRSRLDLPGGRLYTASPSSHSAFPLFSFCLVIVSCPVKKNTVQAYPDIAMAMPGDTLFIKSNNFNILYLRIAIRNRQIEF